MSRRMHKILGGRRKDEKAATCCTVPTAGCRDCNRMWRWREETSEADDVIKIGVFEPLTGANAAGGELEKEGIELANKLYPEVLGKKVELVVVDNKSDKAEQLLLLPVSLKRIMSVQLSVPGVPHFPFPPVISSRKMRFPV